MKVIGNPVKHKNNAGRPDESAARVSLSDTAGNLTFVELGSLHRPLEPKRPPVDSSD